MTKSERLKSKKHYEAEIQCVKKNSYKSRVAFICDGARFKNKLMGIMVSF